MREPIPEVVLNNGVGMPAIGLGVFQSDPEDTTEAVRSALELGYRLIDTAAMYGNEREVGEGLRRSGVDRDAVFLETKVWLSEYGRDATRRAFQKSAAKLGVDRLDLLLLHQPGPERFERTVEAYRALEELLERGDVRAIGVSNFKPHHLSALSEHTTVVPAVNQIELHPYFTQADVQAADAGRGIATQAWSPIGGITHYWGARDGKPPSVMDDPALAEIAADHGRSTAQIMLRWHLQRGRAAVPKSVRKARIRENLDVLGFALTDAELDRIDGLDRGVRGGPDPDVTSPERFETVIPEP